MKISQLAERSGVPLSSIKFYLREGLLPAGLRSAPNQARYGPGHLERLALIRALREVAGLPLEAVRSVLRELDRGWQDGDPVGEALRASLATPTLDPDPETLAELEATRNEVLRFLQPGARSGFALASREFAAGLEWAHFGARLREKAWPA